LFVEALDYEDVTSADVSSFMHSRGPYEPDAVSLVVAYFQQRRVRRDMRNMVRLDEVFRRRSGGAAVTLDTVRAVLA
jgi:lipoate-protein ligase A